jgi:hypothetical protein
LEDLYDLHESFKNESSEKKAAAADTRARDRAEGDAIRDASLGLFVSSRDDDEKENDNPKPVAAAKTTKKGCRLSSGTTAGCHSGGEDNYQMIEAIFKKYSDEKQDEYNERRSGGKACRR